MAAVWEKGHLRNSPATWHESLTQSQPVLWWGHLGWTVTVAGDGLRPGARTRASELHSLKGLASGGPYCVNKGAVVLIGVRTESWCSSFCKRFHEWGLTPAGSLVRSWIYLLWVVEEEHMNLTLPPHPGLPRAALPLPVEAVLHGVITHPDSACALQSWKLGCIDVNSGAFEVSKLGTYLKSDIYFLHREGFLVLLFPKKLSS